MKFISKYREARIVLLPTRKIHHNRGARDETEIIPAVRADFTNGFFDTTEAFSDMKRVQSESGHPGRVESEKDLIKMMKAHSAFGTVFNEFFEESPEEALKRKRKELKDMEEDFAKTEEIQEEPEENQNSQVFQAEVIKDIPSREILETWPYKKLQQVAAEMLGISPVGKSAQMIIDMLEEAKQEEENG